MYIFITYAEKTVAWQTGLSFKSMGNEKFSVYTHAAVFVKPPWEGIVNYVT